MFEFVDRKKDLVKLRGGEYVSLTKVEMVVSKLPFIENCCLCASASSEFTVLLISPNLKQIGNYTEKHFNDNDWQKLINTEEFHKQLLKDLDEICQKGGIERFERPQRVFIVDEVWTPETGLVTDALKLKRKAIENKYEDLIELLYQNKHLQTKLNKKSS